MDPSRAEGAPPTASWPAERRRTTVRDLLILVALTGVPLAVAATTLRSNRDLVVKGIVAGASLVVPLVIGLAWLGCRLARPDEAHMPDWFVVVYMAMTFLAMLAIVTVFMFDRPMAGLLGVGLFGLMVFISTWI